MLSSDKKDADVTVRRVRIVVRMALADENKMLDSSVASNHIFVSRLDLSNSRMLFLIEESSHEHLQLKQNFKGSFKGTLRCCDFFQFFDFFNFLRFLLKLEKSQKSKI